MHPRTIEMLRKRRPDLADIPDDALVKLSIAQRTSIDLHQRDAGRAATADFRRLGESIRRVMRGG